MACSTGCGALPNRVIKGHKIRSCEAPHKRRTIVITLFYFFSDYKCHVVSNFSQFVLPSYNIQMYITYILLLSFYRYLLHGSVLWFNNDPTPCPLTPDNFPFDMFTNINH